MRRPVRLTALAPGLLSIPLAAVLVTGLAVAAGRGGLAPLAGGRAGAGGLPAGAGSADVKLAPGSAPSAAARVRPLGRLYLPDLVVSSPRALTLADLAGVQRLPHVQGVTAALTGTVRYAGRSGRAWGVDASSLRAFTPRPTAASDPVWRSLAGGDLVLAYAADPPRAPGGRRAVPPGARVPLTGPTGHPQRVRVGALAALGLPDVDVLMSRERAAAAGLRAAALLISAPGVDPAALQSALTRVLGGPVGMHLLRAERPAVLGGAGAPAAPATLGALYRAAAGTCPGLPWTVLAAIGQVETDHGRDTACLRCRAPAGRCSSCPRPGATYGVDGNGDGVADIDNQADAIYSAARYLCANGAGQGAPTWRARSTRTTTPAGTSRRCSRWPRSIR